MGRTRESANLVSENNIFVDIANDLVGIGVTSPTVELDVSGNAKVSGIITATSFSGTTTQIYDAEENETSGTYYFTFVDDNNTTASANTLYTDTTLNLNPYGNIVSGGGMDMVAYFINSVEITATATEINFLDGSTAGSAVASETLVVDANRDIDNLGIVTATSFSGSGANLTNVPTGSDPINFVHQVNLNSRKYFVMDFINSLAKSALERGGKIYPLIIPAEENGGLGLMNPSIYKDSDNTAVILRAVNYTFLSFGREIISTSVWTTNICPSQKRSTFKNLESLS